MQIESILAGTRLDVYVSETAAVTRSIAQKWIADGAVTVAGKPQEKNYRLRSGDFVEILPPEAVPAEILPQNIPLTIVYEDDDLLVVNKPQGMVVHPAPGNPDQTLVNALLYHCKDSLSGIGGVIRPGIVHRIDRDTSGLLVVAKNDAAHLSLAAQISAHTCERRYEAILIGHLKQYEGTVDAPIGRHPQDRKKMAIVPDGRSAVTHYAVKESFSVGCDYVALQLESGRTHQIRVHMASLGHPVLGDPVYGSGKHPLEIRFHAYLHGQCLHARTLSFYHPRTKERMDFSSELPTEFTAILQKCRSMEPH